MKTSVTRWTKCPLRISGTVSDPIDLSTLVSTDFIDCKVMAFQMKAAGLHELVDINYKAISEYKIIWTLKTKFQSLVDHGLWIHSEGNKLDMEVDLECNY